MRSSVLYTGPVNKMNRIQGFLSCFVGISFFTYQPQVQAEDIDPTSFSIEQLMESQVSSVSRTDQKFSDTAAAVYVITQEDIQRSGVTNIPDVLRLAPGIQVARVSANNWAVTSRGFNGVFANKLLVLLDGLTVYSPTFAGVRWENLDLVLEDIERIEVIRGPGASTWGQNAVNGVINIITKHTENTQQGLVSITAGNKEHAIVALRYGDQLGDNASYRVFGKFLQHDGLIDLQGRDAQDDWRQGLGGFRMDWNSNAGDRIMLKGNGYVSKLDENFLLPSDRLIGPARRRPGQNSGASILARWEHDFSVASKTNLQFYYDYFKEVDTFFGNETTHTFDIDFQHDIALSENNNFNWGFGYRFFSDSYPESTLITYNPTQQNLHLGSLFIQDKAAFFDDTLQLTIGTKIQYYTLSDWDYQPSARLLWKLHPEHRIWTSFSRATRSPSRAETALSLNPLSPARPFLPHIPSGKFTVQANPRLNSERVLSYELGYRTWVGNRFSADVTLFYNDYKNLADGTIISILQSEPSIFSQVNGATANTRGIETAIDWRPIDSLRLQVSYSFLKVNFRDPSGTKESRTNPKHQLSFRSSYDISPTIAFDTWVRPVDSFSSERSVFGSSRNIDGYIELDIRLAWRPTQNLELSIVGQNLNNKAHLEFTEEFFAYPEQLQRSVYARIRWSFE